MPANAGVGDRRGIGVAVAEARVAVGDWTTAPVALAGGAAIGCAGPPHAAKAKEAAIVMASEMSRRFTLNSQRLVGSRRRAPFYWETSSEG